MAVQEKGVSGDPNTFTLIDKTPGSDVKLLCQPTSQEIKENWVAQITSLLEMQGDFLRGGFNLIVRLVIKTVQLSGDLTQCWFEVWSIEENGYIY